MAMGRDASTLWWIALLVLGFVLLAGPRAPVAAQAAVVLAFCLAVLAGAPQEPRRRRIE